MDKYSAQFVILITAESEDKFHDTRHELIRIGVDCPDWEEDEEGGLWKCIGSNDYWLETVKDVKDLAREIKSIQGVLFEDSSAIIQGTEFDLLKLLKFKKSDLK